MKPANRKTNALVLAISLAIGFSSIGHGSWALFSLSKGYQAKDILYDDGPQLFVAWLKRSSRDGTLTPAAIGQRLLAMPIASRRAAVDVVMQPSFRGSIAEQEHERSAILRTLEAGFVDALATAPSSGELWLAASQTRTLNSGFDAKAESYLAMSYLMAPREAGLTRSRLVFATSVAPLMRRDLADERDRDLKIVKAVYPEFERRFQDWSAGRGADRTGALQRRQSGVAQ